MEVILKQDVENLGLMFDIVSVKPGFARNFLIPNQLVELATKKAKENREVVLTQRAADESLIIKEATSKIDALKNISLKIEAQVGNKSEKLFGSITNSDVSEQLIKNGISIDKKYIKIPGTTIKNTGKYIAKIRLHREVETDFEFEIVAKA
ncbi:MAG: 50S ribosomal protein L9 [Solirubrobacteraceae bacterium]